MGGGLWEIRTGTASSRRRGQRRTKICRRRASTRGSDEMSKKHMGSRIDDFMKPEGVFEEPQSQAVKEGVAWQLFRT